MKKNKNESKFLQHTFITQKQKEDDDFVEDDNNLDEDDNKDHLENQEI